jgi:hypothetical protein
MKQTTLLVLLASMAFGTNTIAQKTTGKFLLAKGQKLQLENTMQTVTGLEMMGQQMEMTADMNTIHDMEVKDKTDSSFYINSTLIKMKSNASIMGQMQSFDSDKKEDIESETGKIMKGTLNVTKEVELNQNAQLIHVKQDTAAAGAGGMMDMIKGMMASTADGGTGTADVFMVIPSGKKAGDTWSDSLIAEGMTMHRNYTLKEIKGNDATVVFTGSQLTNKKIEQMGMEVNINLDAKVFGESLVDLHTGVLKQKTLSMEGTGTAEMMGQSVPMTTKITSTSRVSSR